MVIDTRWHPTKEEIRSKILTEARQGRTQASEGINWFLIMEAQEIQREREDAEAHVDAWEWSINLSLEELDDAPSTGLGHNNDEATRAGLEESLEAARDDRRRIQEVYDSRREVFAAALQEVRDRARIKFDPETIGYIHMLNHDNYLAGELGMSQEDFDSYYGGVSPEAEKITQSASLAQQEVIEKEPESVGVDFSRKADPAPVAEQTKLAQRLAGTSVKHVVVPPEPEHDPEPGFDF